MRNQQSISFKTTKSQTHKNFQELVNAATIFDCLHIVEWESIQRFGHSDFSQLTVDQQAWLYAQSKDKVTHEALRAENATTLRKYLQ